MPRVSDELAWDVCLEGALLTGNVRSQIAEARRWRWFQHYVQHTNRCGHYDSLDWNKLKKHMKQCTSGRNLRELVLWVKLLGGILATETVLHKRGHHTAAAGGVCRLCGAGEETNWHMLAQCCGSADVIQSRMEMVNTVHGVVREFFHATPHFAEAVCQMLQVAGDGTLCEWGGVLLSEEEREREGLHVVLELDLARKVQEVAQRQGGYDLWLKGCTTVEWRQLVQTECGLQPDDALRLTAKLHSAIRKGLDGVWRARCKERAAAVQSKMVKLGTQIQEALQTRRQRAALTGRSIVDGDDERVLKLSSKAQRTWLERYNKGEGLLDEYFRIQPGKRKSCQRPELKGAPQQVRKHARRAQLCMVQTTLTQTVADTTENRRLGPSCDTLVGHTAVRAQEQQRSARRRHEKRTRHGHAKQNDRHAVRTGKRKLTHSGKGSSSRDRNSTNNMMSYFQVAHRNDVNVQVATSLGTVNATHTRNSVTVLHKTASRAVD